MKSPVNDLDIFDFVLGPSRLGVPDTRERKSESKESTTSRPSSPTHTNISLSLDLEVGGGGWVVLGLTTTVTPYEYKHTHCLDRVDLVMASLIPVPCASFPGEADHLGIPLDGLRPNVADPELITRVGG